MRNLILIGLMAATALLPVSAIAQERGQRGPRGERSASRPDQPVRVHRPEGGRPEGRRSEPRPQAQPRNDQPGADRSQGRVQDRGERFQRFRGQANPTPTAERPRGERPAFDQRAQGERGDRVRDRSRELGRSTLPNEQYRGSARQRSNAGQGRGDWQRDDRRGTIRNDDRRFNRDQDRRWDRNDGQRWDRDDDRRRYNGNAQDWRDNDRNRWDRNDRQRWSRSWRNDRRYDWSGYRQANRHLYRLPRYYPPSGYNYGYQRFSVGLTLGAMLFQQSYWINDPWEYRLPPADGPYRWVRYYNDALLVDLESGEVVDVINDLFW